MHLRAWLKDTFAKQLSLFEEPLAAAPLKHSSPQPSTPDPRALPSDPPPPLSITEALTPTSFAHPLANRRIVLGGQDLSYLLKRGKRRTIGLQITADGLSVSAPRHTGVREIESVLLEKADWVLKKLAEVREKSAKREAQRITWAHGAELPYLGKPIRLVLDAEHAWNKANKAQPQLVVPETGIEPVQLHLGLPKTASEQQIRDAAQAWLMRQATRVFTERLAFFAPQIGVRYTRMRLSSADTRWGSASADGAIRLNWRLIHLPMRSIDYVVAHELSHLREMNHSPQFWSVVGSVMPDYAARRKELKADASPRWA